MRTAFDVGMYDGTDTAYYLDAGFRVVAVEANPELVRKAEEGFADAIAEGRLVLEGVAVAPERGMATLVLNQVNPGGSTLFQERLAEGEFAGTQSVRAVTMSDLLEAHGVPYFMKVDIEGADRHCILALTRQQAPEYVSFEMGEDAEELLDHLAGIGYRRFKAIHQITFRELSNVECVYDRAARRAMRLLGYADPRLVRRGGRFFWSGHSSGPLPTASDGRWSDASSLRRRWRNAQRKPRAGGWYDLHASLR